MSQPIKILLVDDVEQNLVALEALLTQPEVQPMRATSGAEALEILLKHDVALALVDVQMPEMDGFELAELMRGSARTRHVPIIFLTATDRNAVRTFRGYEAGAVDFLYKPFDPHILRSKVEVFVQLQSQKLQLAEQLESLRQMIRMNEMFVAVLGHDLRNPLSSILSCAEILPRLSDDERVSTSAQRIRSSGTRMARMIDQLLDIARVRSGQLALAPENADLASICQNIIAEFEGGEATRKVQLSVQGDSAGRWDIDRLAQVMSNLIGNALQHGDAGAPVRVSIDGTSSEDLRASVWNAGEMPAELLDQIFKPFFPATLGSQTKRAGLGLGLYIAHELVRLHGGRLAAHSSAEGGTQFDILLPRHAPLAAVTNATLANV
ncbi:MAG: hybrid sensor histidine kinase/response regulator [Janthinobacterium lividum]